MPARALFVHNLSTCPNHRVDKADANESVHFCGCSTKCVFLPVWTGFGSGNALETATHVRTGLGENMGDSKMGVPCHGPVWKTLANCRFALLNVKRVKFASNTKNNARKQEEHEDKDNHMPLRVFAEGPL